MRWLPGSIAFERRCSENFSVLIVSVFNDCRDYEEYLGFAAEVPEGKDKIY